MLVIVRAWRSRTTLPEPHLLTEGQVISSLHHHLHQLAQLGFDLDGVNHVSQNAHVPGRGGATQVEDFRGCEKRT